MVGKNGGERFQLRFYEAFLIVSRSFLTGRSSAWLERLVWVQQVARSNRVAPTIKKPPKGDFFVGRHDENRRSTALLQRRG